MTTVTIQGHEVEVKILSFDRGCPPHQKGHPDTWTPGDSGFIEFKFETGNELFNELLTENHYKEAENQLLAAMENPNG